MTPVLKRFSSTTFASLYNPNYRLFIGGQGLSLVGTWMQITAQAWLVLEITHHSATKLGLIVALQTLPILLFGAYGGVIADRVSKRKSMIILQLLMGVQALALGLLTVTHHVRFWEIGVLALILGFNNMLENPIRQSFMLELVGPDDLRNAVSLNSTIGSIARMVGPGLAGLLIATVGEGTCFLLNAASFLAVITSLTRLDLTKLSPSKQTPRAPGQLREGFSYVRRNRPIAMPLLMMAIVGCFALEFQVSLPYMATNGLHIGAGGDGAMFSAMSLGSIVGGLFVASRGKVGSWVMIAWALGFGVSAALAAIAPNLAIELLMLAFAGATSVAFVSVGNSTLQLRAAPDMRGRVMGLWFVAFQGSTPIGGPVVGATMALLGARSGLGVAALACFVAALLGAATLHRAGVVAGAASSAYQHPVIDSETDGPDGEMPPPIGPVEPAVAPATTQA